MLKAVIIDDEEKARENLSSLLEEFCSSIEVVAMEGTVKDASKAIDDHQPDVVFLDIKMRGETGFDLLEELGDFDFSLIFTTAYNEYALKAFKFSAIDYLLKPINIDELVSAVNRIEKKHSNTDNERFESFMANIKNAGKSFNKIALPTSDGLIFVKTDEIIRCESSDNYTNFFLQNGDKILVSKTIKYFEELLEGHNFFRVHQSHLINLDHIKKYFKGDGGYTLMADESTVMVSRRKKESFLKKFAKQ